MLGIFGQQKLDSATYWGTVDELGPIGLAYWLFRGCVFLCIGFQEFLGI
jgi:hypothetical protein